MPPPLSGRAEEGAEIVDEHLGHLESGEVRITIERREEPVYRTPDVGWLRSRHDDVAAALKDVATFRADLAIMARLELADIPDDELFLSELLELRHGRVRRMFNACLAAHPPCFERALPACLRNEPGRS